MALANRRVWCAVYCLEYIMLHDYLISFFNLNFILVEHILYIASTLYNNYKHIEYCQLDVNFIQMVFEKERAHIFDIIPYSHWLIVPVEVICNFFITTIYNPLLLYSVLVYVNVFYLCPFFSILFLFYYNLFLQ